MRVKEEAEIAFSELVYYSGIYKTNTLITNEIIILTKITLNFAYIKYVKYPMNFDIIR